MMVAWAQAPSRVGVAEFSKVMLVFKERLGIAVLNIQLISIIQSNVL